MQGYVPFSLNETSRTTGRLKLMLEFTFICVGEGNGEFTYPGQLFRLFYLYVFYFVTDLGFVEYGLVVYLCS